MEAVKKKGGEGDTVPPGLTEEERRALRGSKFAPLSPSDHPSSSSRYQPRLAHPGGPVATNKAAALAKFLERKLQQPGGLESIDPNLLEVAVKNAKETVKASGTSNSGRVVRHVTSFDDDSCEVFEKEEKQETRKRKKKKKKATKISKATKEVKHKKSKS